VAFIYARFGVAVFESTPYVPVRVLCAPALQIVTVFYWAYISAMFTAL